MRLRLTLLALALSSAVLVAQAPIPKALVEAKTVHLVNQGANDGTYNGIAKELLKWGRFELVDAQEASDLTMTVSGLVAFKGWTLAVTSTATKAPLWSGRAKRGLGTSVAEGLVKKLRKSLGD
jgi:hypothetical protein